MTFFWWWNAILLECSCHVYKPKLNCSWFRLLGQGLDRQQLMFPHLWLGVGNWLLASGVFCYVTINVTKVDSKWCFCTVLFSTGNWSISQVIPKKQVVEQIAKNERFILHQSIKTDAVCSSSLQKEQTPPHHWHQTNTAYSMKFAFHRHPEYNWNLVEETNVN